MKWACCQILPVLRSVLIKVLQNYVMSDSMFKKNEKNESQFRKSLVKLIDGHWNEIQFNRDAEACLHEWNKRKWIHMLVACGGKRTSTRPLEGLLQLRLPCLTAGPVSCSAPRFHHDPTAAFKVKSKFKVKTGSLFSVFHCSIMFLSFDLWLELVASPCLFFCGG